jgi:AcrR family transcriptional regulator
MSGVDGAVQMDPRTVRTREHVLRVAIAILGDKGAAGLTFAVLAERSRVSRQTLYRYWTSTERLLIDIVLSFKPADEPVLALAIGNELRDQVQAFLRAIRDSLAEPATQAALTAVICSATHDDSSSQALVEMAAERRAAFAAFYGDVSPAQFGAILAPVFFAQLLAQEPADDAALTAATEYALALHAALN